MGTIVKIDGCNVAVATGAAFIKVAQKFKSETGLTLHIKSGLRTRLEQTNLWNDYMSGKGGLAAKPGTSEHETGRALDVYDSGNDPGVTVAGTARHIIVVRLMLEEGFKATGDTFGEPWHFEFWKTDPYKIPVSIASTGSNNITEIEDDMGCYVQVSSQGSKYWYSESTGKLREIGKAEWDARRALEHTAGGLPLKLVNVSQQWLDARLAA